jgi:hypothetical protein
MHRAWTSAQGSAERFLHGQRYPSWPVYPLGKLAEGAADPHRFHVLEMAASHGRRFSSACNQEHGGSVKKGVAYPGKGIDMSNTGARGDDSDPAGETSHRVGHIPRGLFIPSVNDPQSGILSSIQDGIKSISAKGENIRNPPVD